MYYDSPEQWITLMKRSLTDIIPAFDSKRMADEYYRKLYMSQKADESDADPNTLE
jgi:starch phosphorylase